MQERRVGDEVDFRVTTHKSQVVRDFQWPRKLEQARILP